MVQELTTEDRLAYHANYLCQLYRSEVMPSAGLVKSVEDLLGQAKDCDANLVEDVRELMRRMWAWVSGMRPLDACSFTLRLPPVRRK